MPACEGVEWSGVGLTASAWNGSLVEFVEVAMWIQFPVGIEWISRLGRARTTARWLAVAWLVGLAPLLLDQVQVQARAQDAPRTTPSSDEPLESGALYRRLLSASVWIVHDVPNDKDRLVTGTGWLLDANRRLVVTNHHVVSAQNEKQPTEVVADDSIRIYFPWHRDGRLEVNRVSYLRDAPFVKARVIDSDPKRDLAVLQLEAFPKGITPTPLPPAAENTTPGERIHSIGNPGASGGMWVYTSGTVRQVYPGKARLEHNQRCEYLTVETQSPINGGDSGGPVVDDLGRLVAICSASREGASLISVFVAVSELKDLLAEIRGIISPRTAEEFEARAHRHHARGRSEQAIQDYSEALRLEPKRVASLNGRGLCFYEKGDHDTAIADLNEAIRLGTDNSDSYNVRGLAWMGKKQPDRAINDLTAAIRIDPTTAALHDNRGDAHRMNKDHAAAVVDYTEAIRLAPTSALYHDDRGHAYYDQKDYARAIKDYQQALDLADETEAPRYLLHLGNAFTAKGDVTEAHRAYDLLEKADPQLAAEQSEQYFRRYLRIANKTSDRVIVYVKYRTYTSNKEWKWYPQPPGVEGWIRFTFEPGEETFLSHEDWKINADRVRLHAVSEDLTKQDQEFKDRDLVLCEDEGYKSLYMKTFLYVIGGKP